MAPHASGLDSAEVAILIVRTGAPEVWPWLLATAVRASAAPPMAARPKRRDIDLLGDIFSGPFLLDGAFRVEELGEARACGCIEDLGRAAFGGDDPLIHEDDAARDVLGELHFMGHEQRGDP